MKCKLIIEENEIELTEDVSFALNKQFETLENPTIIINDWSKSVHIPFSNINNKIFNNLFNPDRINGDGEGMMVHFDPLKKLDFRLEWNDSVIMTGYAKMNSVTRDGAYGYYDITLNGQLGKLFQEMKKITFDPNDELGYIIDGSKYVSANIDRNLVKQSFESEGQKTAVLADSDLYDIIGFAPNNSFSEDFDYKSFEAGDKNTTMFKDVLGDDFKTQTGIDAETVIKDGMTPRGIGEYRSYHQIPYIWFNKLFQIFQEKSEEVTGYEFKLDEDWFSTNNPYWYNLIYCLKNLDNKDNITYTNKYNTVQSTFATCKYMSSTYSRTGYEPAPNYYPEFNIVSEREPIFDGEYFNLINGGYQVISATFDLDVYVAATLNKNFDTNTLVRLSENVGIELNLYVDDGIDQNKLVSIIIVGEGSTIDTTPYNYTVVMNNKYMQNNGDEIFASTTIQNVVIDNIPVRDKFKIYSTMNIIDNLGSGVNYISVFQYKTSSSWASVAIGDINYELRPSNLTFNTTVIKNRSLSHFTLNDLWDRKYNLFEQIINYCKMYRILIYIDEFNKQIVFEPANKYMSRYVIEDWTRKLDMSKDYVLTPITFDNKYVLFNYDTNETKLAKAYEGRYGLKYGEFKVITDYNFNNNTTNLFKNVKQSLISSDNVLSWNMLYSNKKIIYILPNENSIHSADDSGKFKSCFGQYYFHNGRKKFDTYDGLRSVIISDDTVKQQNTNTFVYSQYSDYVRCQYYPDIDIKREHKGTTIYCTFGIPKELYSYDSNIGDNNYSIYNNIWRRYLYERYNPQNKKVTCYLKLSPIDILNFRFNKFIIIENQLYFVNKIYDFDPSETNLSTKVDLLTISNIEAYTTIDYDSSSPKEIVIKDYTTPRISGNIETANFYLTYVQSYYDLNFMSGDKQTVVGGVELTIVPTHKVIGGIEYNYVINYRKVERYNRDNDTVYATTITNGHNNQRLEFIRYRDYPNPPVMTKSKDKIQQGIGIITLKVETQFPPLSISYGHISGLTLSQFGEWEYHNDDYVYYTLDVRYQNNYIGTSETSTYITVMTGSGYQITQSIGVKNKSISI